MKPNFALKLSNDGIELLHRDPGGWLSLGSVSFETDDVEAGCARLLAHAKQLAPDGIRTKLVLPDSQLRYATVLAPGPTDEARRYQIEAEIEALTPYAIDELVYDWSVEDDHALIVICTKETLAEAEGFCDASGFNPVSFVAAPEHGTFVGEPNFGLTTVARAYLPAGETVQFDAEPVVVTGVAPSAPSSGGVDAPATPQAERQTPKQSATPGAPASAAQPKVAAPKAPVGRDGGRPKVEAQPRPIAAPSQSGSTPADSKSISPNPDAAAPASEPLAKVGNLVRRIGTRLRREQAQADTASGAPGATPRSPAPVDKSAPKSAPSLARKPAPASAPAAAAPIAGLPPRGTPSGAAKPGDAKPVLAPTLAAKLGDAKPGAGKNDTGKPGGANPADSSAAAQSITRIPTAESGSADAGANSSDSAAAVSFASRRRQAPVVAASNDAVPQASNPGGRLAVLSDSSKDKGPGFAARLAEKFKRTAQQAVAATNAKRQAKANPADAVTPAATVKPATPPADKPGLGMARKWQRDPTPPAPIVAASRPPASEREKASEAEAMTIFGARGNVQTDRGIAGRGLMLGGGVALLLVAVAVWFLYFNGNGSPVELAQNDASGTSTMPQIAAPDSVGEGTQTATTDVGTQSTTPQIAGTDDATLQVDDGSATDIPAGAVLPDTSGVAPSTVEPAETGTTQLAEGQTDGADSAGADGALTGESADPDRLMESLVQEALNEALPAETLERAEQVIEATDQATTELAETAPEGQPTTQVAGVGDASAAASSQASDTPQLAAATAATTQRMSLPTGFDMPRLGEVAFERPAPPPPFGAEFTFNDNGLVEATPEGALTPLGITVYARRPDVVPAPRPEGIAPESALAPEPTAEPTAEPAPEPAPEAAPEPEPVAPVTVVPDDTPRADPALADARPQPRSERVRLLGEQLAPQAPEPEPEPAPTEAGEEQQDAALDAPESSAPTATAALDAPPPGGVSLAALRPQTRPTDLVPPALLPDPDLDTAEATPEAVAASLRPSARPESVAERARAALASAGSSAPTRAEIEDDEGETASAAAQPSIPSSASVARQATETNAINLSRVNLIGVFGTQENRRALVRLSSGRVVRLQVGDRLDGGEVTAIGDSELRYTRRGRNETLEIGG